MSKGLSKVSSRKDLKALQKSFFSIITRPLGKNSVMARDSRTIKMIRPSRLLTPHERLELYAQQYWWRVLDSLREDFAGLHDLLGEEKFSKLMVRYVQRFPSKSFTLRKLGQFMPRFLKKDRSLPAALRAQAIAIAEVEWAQVLVFDGPALPILTVEALQGMGDRVRIQLQPYVRLLTVPYTVDSFLGTSRSIAMPSGASNVRAPAVKSRRRALRKALKKETCHLAVYRIGASVRLARLDAVERSLLDALVRGGSLEQVFRRVLKGKKALASDAVQAAFQRFGSLGVIGPSG
jgi:hypothetical protein